MSKRQIIMVLGVWVMILFVLGLPNSIKEILALVTGVVIVVVASRMKSDEKVEPTAMPYVESRRPPMGPDPEPVQPPAPKADIINPQDPPTA